MHTYMRTYGNNKHSRLAMEYSLLLISLNRRVQKFISYSLSSFVSSAAHQSCYGFTAMQITDLGQILVRTIYLDYCSYCLRAPAMN